MTYKFEDNKKYNSNFIKYWNSFVNSETPKVQFTLDEFLEKMYDDDYLRSAINKMEYQDRIISCQYIKISNEEHGFANFFLMRLPKNNSLCCGSNYYFIYKHRLNEIYDSEQRLFLPKRSIYKKLDISPDSLDYLANFAVEIGEKDYVYCLSCNKLLKSSDLFSSKVLVLSK